MKTKRWDLLILVCFTIVLWTNSSCLSQESEDDTFYDVSDEYEYQVETILKTISEFNNLTMFNELLKYSGLIETIKDTGIYTLLIPEDSAFYRLPSDTLERLMTDMSYLKSVLSRHIIKGKIIDFNYQETTMKLKTLGGNILTAEVTLESVVIEQAWVIEEDIECSNGVIHIIDEVLLPQEG